MQRLGCLLGWSLVVYTLIAIFGETTGPLLIILAADGTVGLLIVRGCMEMRAATIALPADRIASPRAQRELRGGGY